jgi:hypothetical protein
MDKYLFLYGLLLFRKGQDIQEKPNFCPYMGSTLSGKHNLDLPQGKNHEIGNKLTEDLDGLKKSVWYSIYNLDRKFTPVLSIVT